MGNRQNVNELEGLQAYYRHACSLKQTTLAKIHKEHVQDVLSNLLLEYFVCESLYRRLYAKANNLTAAKEIREIKVTVPQVKSALKAFGISFDAEIIGRLFGSPKSNMNSKTMKQLRNEIVHGMNPHAIDVLLERKNQIDNDISYFLNLFTKKED